MTPLSFPVICAKHTQPVLLGLRQVASTRGPQDSRDVEGALFLRSVWGLGTRSRGVKKSRTKMGLFVPSPCQL